MSKTLSNTTASQAKDNVKDIVFWGDGNTFKLISKASSVNEGWMKPLGLRQLSVDFLRLTLQWVALGPTP